MVKELFYSNSCLHFKTLNMNNSYNADLSDNLSVAGNAYGTKHCCEIISHANLHLFNAQEAK